MWCSAVDTHLKLLDRAVSGARFLTDGAFECDIAHRWSVAVLCMLYKIRCNKMHPLSDALPGPYVSVRVTCGALIAHRYTSCICATSLQNLAVPHAFFSTLSVSLERFYWRVRWCGTGGFQKQCQCFFIGLSCSIPTIVFYYFFLSLLPVYWLVLWGWGLRTNRVYIPLSQPCTADLF